MIEVIIAVGLFASSVAVVLGLIAALSRQGADAGASLAAQRLPDALKVELSRLAGADLDNLAGQIPLMSAPLADGFGFVAPRDASRIDSVVAPPAAEQYYYVECWKFPDEPLRFDSQKAFLALQVRVSWPYRLPGATAATNLADRSQVTFTVALNR
ncbi:MAG: hypothetical protein HYX71_01075 [Opitutae bacterium]|nr:hypothetical protein [Opitutae bacterium]